jgi:hypothetical protein
MSIHAGPRFTLGQSMAATAVIALLISAALAEGRYDPAFTDPRFLLSTFVLVVGAGVCLYNLRLSRGMWLVLVGYIGPRVVGWATQLTFAVRGSALDSDFIARVGRVAWLANSVLSLVFVAGLAVTFRDIRRRLPTSGGPRR